MEQSVPSAFSVFAPLSSQAIILTGPTASGKSRLAIRLAQQLDAEIISLDSIAVYVGMDIGTAKPSRADQTTVPHHLIDVVSPDKEFSVNQYLRLANDCVGDILQRGKRPLFVGGTPLYMKGLLYGFDAGPPADWNFRESVEADLAAYGAEALHDRLGQVDPLSAHRLPPTDTRRIIRALEVAYLTGVPLSHRQTQFEASTAPQAHVFSLAWPRAILHQRIATRVETMFASGLVDEVNGLLHLYPTLSRTAATAVGYREVLNMLAGKGTLPEAKESTLFHTRRLARRQETWFRSLPTLVPIAVDCEQAIDAACALILQRLEPFRLV